MTNFVKQVKTVLVSGTAVTALMAGGTAFAQNNDAQSEDEDDNVIIVTAQKIEQNVQDIPLSITAITDEKLDRAGVTDPSRLEFVAPNVSFGKAGADSRISIRGVSSTGIEVNSDPVIGLFVDSVYQSRTAQALAGFVDIARVEVVRGPQGTISGRNTTGGAINFVSKSPEDEFDFGIDGLVGNFDHFSARGFINIPLGEGAAFRLAGLREVRDGYAENLFRVNDTNNDEDQLFLRGSLSFDIGPDTNVIIRGSYWDQGGQGAGFNAYRIDGQQVEFDGAFNFTNPFTSPAFSIAGVDPGGNPRDPYTFSNDIQAVRDIEQGQFSLEFTHDFGGVVFKSITAYNTFDRFTRQDSDFSELDQFAVELTQSADTFTQEIQLSSSGEGPFDWIVGAYFLDDDVQELFNVPILPDSTLGFLGPSLIFRPATALTTSYAIFGQATYAITDRIRITGGLRWTRDEKEFDLTNVFGVMVQDAADFEEVTWRAAIDFDIGDSTLLYGYAASGFRSGGFNLNGSPSYDPETVIAYEIGVKHTFDGIGFINVAAFLSDFDDLQVNSFDPVTISSFIQNAAQAEIKGFEIEGEVNPGNWTLTAAVSYQDAEYDGFIASSPFPGTPGTVDLSGRSLPRAPEFSARLSASYDIDLGGSGTLRPIVQFAYFSEQFQTEFNQVLDRQEGYTKTDFRLYWESENQQFFAEAFIQNIENEAVLVSGVYGPGAGLFANYGAPRTYGLRFGYNYDAN